jgi:hypothetical protein
LDFENLTDRGNRDMRNNDVRRLGVFGTPERYDEMIGRLEILPMAVFSRVGR